MGVGWGALRAPPSAFRHLPPEGGENWGLRHLTPEEEGFGAVLCGGWEEAW